MGGGGAGPGLAKTPRAVRPRKRAVGKRRRRTGAGSRAVGKYHEHICWDPKDGELCLARMKPEETLVEVRSDSDVQIDRRSWV